MARDYLMIGATPHAEPCAQTGFHPTSLQRLECSTFILQLQDLLEQQFETIQISLRIKPEYHDFGTYYEVAAYYDDDNEESVEQAYWLEENTPENWSQASIELLTASNYFSQLESITRP